LQLTLASGTRAAFEVSPDFGAAGVVLVMGTGSVDDPHGKEGLAHLVEHLVFHSRHDHDSSFRRKLQALGAGAWNAWTTWDSTGYFAFGPTASLPGVAALVAGVADDPLADVDEASFEHERAVVLDELHSRAEDGTPGQILRFVDAAVFSEHPYSRSAIGTDESISSLTLSDALAFAKANYRPSRAVLATSAPMGLAEQEAMLQRIAAEHRWPHANPEIRAVASRLPDEEREDGSPSLAVESHELPVPTPTLWIGWSIPSATSPDAPAAAIVASMVGGVFAQHVYDHDWDIVSVRASIQPGALSSLFYVTATLKEGSHPRDAASSLLSTMSRGLSERINYATGFSLFKQSVATSLLEGEQQMISRTMNVAESLDLTGSPTFLRGSVDRTTALSSDRVEAFYRHYLTSQRAHAIFVSPLPGASSKSAPAPRSPEKALELDAAVIPSDVHAWMKVPGVSAAQRTTLPNGMQSVVLAEPGAAFHSVVVAYHGGTGMERTPGAAIVSQWARLRQGPGVWGIVHDEEVTLDANLDTVRAVGSDVRETLRLMDEGNLREIEWTPGWMSNQFDVFEKRQGAPNGIFERALSDRFFGAHPYGAWPTAAKLRAVTPNDVYTFVESVRRPGNGIVVIVGDVDPEQTTQLLASGIGRGSPETPKDVPTPPPLETVDLRPGARLFVVNRPGSDTARVGFRCALPAVKSEDWGKTLVFERALGSGLLTELRERTATSYSVSNDVVLLRGGTAMLRIAADIDHGHLPNAIAALRRMVESAPASLLDERALTVARAAAASGFNLQLDTPHELSMAIVDAWNLGWPVDAIDSLPRQIEAAKVEDLTRALDHCQRNWVLGIVGDEARIRAALGGWSP
jgi:zinc protease